MIFSEQDSEQEREARVARLVAKHEKESENRMAFAAKFDFSFKRPQYFKNCITIRWKATKKKYEIDHDRLREYTKICEDLSDKYGLWEEDDPFMDTESRLLKAGIYLTSSSDFHLWTIPNEYKEVQDYVLSKLPEWAKVTKKDKNGRNAS